MDCFLATSLESHRILLCALREERLSNGDSIGKSIPSRSKGGRRILKRPIFWDGFWFIHFLKTTLFFFFPPSSQRQIRLGSLATRGLRLPWAPSIAAGTSRWLSGDVANCGNARARRRTGFGLERFGGMLNKNGLAMFVGECPFKRRL